jgi:uncharacterized protein YqgC (DUF456 family)
MIEDPFAWPLMTAVPVMRIFVIGMLLVVIPAMPVVIVVVVAMVFVMVDVNHNDIAWAIAHAMIVVIVMMVTAHDHRQTYRTYQRGKGQFGVHRLVIPPG